MGSLPYGSLPRDDQRGGCGPLFGFSPGQSLRDEFPPLKEKGLELMRGIPKGGAPLCVVAEEGVTGEKPHRKGFSPVRVVTFCTSKK